MKHLNQTMKKLCLQVILLPKKQTQNLCISHTQRRQIYTTSPQKPISGLCQGHTRIFKVQKKWAYTRGTKQPKGISPQSLSGNVSRWKAKIVWSPLESRVDFFIILKAVFLPTYCAGQKITHFQLHANTQAQFSIQCAFP